jgi:hypothetical protein
MIPGKYTIKFYRATTLNIALVYKVDGVAQSLAGYTARMDVRTAADTASTITSFTSAGGGLVLNETTGRIRIYMAAAGGTALLSVGEFVYDINITAPDGTVEKLLRGPFIVLDPVTE